MKSFIAHLGLILLSTCLFTCGTAPRDVVVKPAEPNDGWRVFTAPDRSFSVELPCNPDQPNVSEPATPVYQYHCGGEVDGALRFFVVSALKLSEREKSKLQDEATFERSVKDSFTANKRIIKLIPLRIENGSGREFVVTNTGEDMDNMRGRVILYGVHRYEVAFVASNLKALESQEAERFFASFKPLQ